MFIGTWQRKMNGKKWWQKKKILGGNKEQELKKTRALRSDRTETEE